MKYLPPEILNNVFLNLSLNQKLICFQVCREWRDILRSGCLLHTVDLSGLNEIDRFLEFLHNNPDRQGQVKHVNLVNNFEIGFHVPTLCLYFPKLITMCLKEVQPYDPYFRIPPDPEMAGLEDLRHTITTIIEFGHCDYMRQLLVSGVCHKLTSLTLDLNSATNEDELDIIRVVTLFQNAPNVLKLTMAVSSFNIPTLELLHIHLQQLETLVLHCMEFIINQHNHLPRNIIPASSVKDLSIDFADLEIDAQLLLLDYIKIKYSHVQSFGFYGADPDVWDERDISRLTTSGFKPLIQHYGLQIKSLHIQSLVSDSTIFTVMDELDYKLESLTISDVGQPSIFKMIVASNQYNFIKELSLNGVDTSATPFELLDRFTCLCKLKLCLITVDDYEATINLNTLLDACSNTLTSLTLSNATLTFNEYCGLIQNQYSLQKLELDSDNIPSGFSLFLSTHCRNLTHLTLNGRRPFVMTLNIPNIHLSCFSLRGPTSESALDLSVTTLDDNDHRSYCIHYENNYSNFHNELTDTFGTSFCHTVSQVPLSSRPTFELICASVKDVLINNILGC